MSSIRGAPRCAPFFAQIISGNFKIGIAIFLRLCYNSQGSLADVCLTFPGESWKPVCWNRQTRWTQNPLVAIPCGFKSRHRHQTKASSIRMMLLFLVWMQGLEGCVLKNSPGDCFSAPPLWPQPGKSRHRHQNTGIATARCLYFLIQTKRDLKGACKKSVCFLPLHIPGLRGIIDPYTCEFDRRKSL